ncbi:MAG: hypothetical protein ACPG4T_03160 [Nannocystaceae bacterium]
MQSILREFVENHPSGGETPAIGCEGAKFEEKANAEVGPVEARVGSVQARPRREWTSPGLPT